MSSGELVEGQHYFKRRGRVIFSWPAMRAWVEQRAAIRKLIANWRNVFEESLFSNRSTSR